METPKSVMERGDYLKVTYSEQRAPRGSYPARLAAHLAGQYFPHPGRLLDFGCGRGEFVAAFADLGFDSAGVDISPAAPEFAPGHDVRVADLEKDPLPFPPASFDFVFSKSVIEHVREPVALLEKLRGALKPGGIAVIMTPSWVHTYWGPFYLDHTHVTPFTVPSLRDCIGFAGLELVRLGYFWQLPFLWRYPALTPLVRAFALLPLPYQPMAEVAWPAGFNKLIRFSKEAMILCVARRPLEDQTP